MHVCQLCREVAPSNLLLLNVVVVGLKLRLEQLVTLHPVHAPLLVLPVFLVGVVVDFRGLLLKALQMLLILRVLLVSVGLSDQVLHLLSLLGLLALLFSDPVDLDPYLLVKVGLLDVCLALLL